MMNNVPLWKKIIDVFTIIILGLGVIVGYWAYETYKNNNNAQMINTLLGSDIEMYRLMMEKPNLQGIFALPPINQDAKSTATQILRIIINDNNDNICNDWKDIPELYENIFGLKDDFNSKNKMELRNAYFVGELIVFDILTAFEAYNYELIKKEDYETYTGYFSEMGGNPIFLCAVYLTHRCGYITKKFAQEIKNRLLASPKRKHTIEVLYPDLLKDDWVDRVGEMK